MQKEGRKKRRSGETQPETPLRRTKEVLFADQFRVLTKLMLCPLAGVLFMSPAFLSAFDETAHDKKRIQPVFIEVFDIHGSLLS
ncbi:MAG: hypothetical protein PUC15_08045 [Lentisphaeria bacterium]|nr:hypothetical protein [Lentisphaeria bacterium]